MTGFIKSHSSLTHNSIKDLLSEAQDSNTERLKLSDLSATELSTFRDWARDNLEATEKRLVPTFWMLTLGGLLINTSFFEKWVKGWYVYFSNQYSVFHARESIFTISGGNIQGRHGNTGRLLLNNIRFYALLATLVGSVMIRVFYMTDMFVWKQLRSESAAA